jgi:hypothetical protein
LFFVEETAEETARESKTRLELKFPGNVSKDSEYGMKI